MRRRYDSLIVLLVKVYFLILLITESVHGYPHQVQRKTRGIDEFPDSSESSESSQTSSDVQAEESQDEVGRLVERAFRNGELLDVDEWSGSNRRGPNRSVQRDTSRYEDTYTGESSVKTQTRTAKDHQEQSRLFRNQEDSSSTERMQSDGKFVFPTDDLAINDRNKFDVRTAPVCRGSTYCERSTYYPEDLVNKAIHQNDSLKYLASIDVVSDIVQRIDVTDDTPLCVSTEQVVYPKSAENKRKEWLFVVNQDNFKQGVRIETCSNENTDCSLIDGLAEGYKTSCRQKYIYRQLAAVSSDGTVAPEMFRFPSSCCCHVKFTGNPLSRMGISLGEARSQTTTPRTGRRK